VLLVSHDRAFLDNVATSVIASEGGGKWREYVGGFTDWQIQRERSQQMALDAQKEANKDAAKDTASGKDTSAGRNTQRAAKLSFKEQRELEALPQKIAALEAEQKTIGAQLEDGSVFARDAQEGTRLTERYAAIDEELLVALERWDELEKRRK
jgi:ATP-binding cassette subfamily F protein uup